MRSSGLSSVERTAFSWGGAYLFDTNDKAAYSVLQQTASSSTRLALDIVRSVNGLKLHIAPVHTFQLADSIAAVVSAARSKKAAELIVYDIEHWTNTPPTEQQDPIGAITIAAREAHAAGKAFGLAPDGLFLGITPYECTFNIDHGILSKIDWNSVDVLIVQAQALAHDSRCPAIGMYRAFVEAASVIARTRNPNISIVGELSFRDTSAARMLYTAASVATTLSGIYVAYPKANCQQCTPENLQTVLNALK